MQSQDVAQFPSLKLRNRARERHSAIKALGQAQLDARIKISSPVAVGEAFVCCVAIYLSHSSEF